MCIWALKRMGSLSGNRWHLVWVNTGIFIKQQKREGGLVDFPEGSKHHLPS